MDLMQKRVALFEVKALDDSDPSGEFEAILSVPTIDRDGEIIDAKAFEPLPDFIPIHKYHDFTSPVASAFPFYDGDVLKARGVFDPDPESQTFRSKVGRSVRFMSVGFMAAIRNDADDVPHITSAELLESSFVTVSSNRDAAVLALKGYQEAFEMKASKGERLQQIHDLSVANGATCESKAAHAAEEKTPATDPETKTAAPAADAAGAAVEPPADVTVGMAPTAIWRTRAELLLLD